MSHEHWFLCARDSYVFDGSSGTQLDKASGSITVFKQFHHSRMDARVQQFLTDAQRPRDAKTPKDIAKLR